MQGNRIPDKIMAKYNSGRVTFIVGPDESPSSATLHKGKHLSCSDNRSTGLGTVCTATMTANALQCYSTICHDAGIEHQR